MKTKSISKLKLSKEVVVLLNDNASNVNGGATITTLATRDVKNSCATACLVCEANVIKGKF